MKNIKEAKTVYQKIKEFESIICLRHVNPDGDAFGSQLGLKKLITLNFPEKKVYAVGQEVNFFKSLGDMDKIDDAIFEKSLVIITDTASVGRIDNQQYEKSPFIIKIDHHSNENQFGDSQWVDADFTSASEMIGFLAKVNKMKINEDIAKTIMFGITTDTNRFYSSKVNQTTFDVCSYLMKDKWNITTLYDQVYKKKINYLKAESLVIQNMKINNNVGAMFLTKDIMEKYSIPYDQNDIFTNLLQGVDDIEIWVVFSTNENGTYRTEFRSNRFSVKDIAQKYGGGGHDLMAGCTINDLKIAQDIIKDLEDQVLKNKKE